MISLAVVWRVGWHKVWRVVGGPGEGVGGGWGGGGGHYRCRTGGVDWTQAKDCPRPQRIFEHSR